jgi:septal ring factor EnvC (AmiA/AmiB activator)
MKQDIEHKNQYIRDHDQKFSELQQLLNASEEEVKQLKEQLAAVSEEDEQDEPNERTQKVVTNYLFSILKKAGMGNDM